jgi:hypothetical protein
VNLYVYGENNPVNFVDPSGYFSMHFGPMIDGMYTSVEAIDREVESNKGSSSNASKYAISAGGSATGSYIDNTLKSVDTHDYRYQESWQKDSSPESKSGYKRNHLKTVLNYSGKGTIGSIAAGVVVEKGMYEAGVTNCFSYTDAITTGAVLVSVSIATSIGLSKKMDTGPITNVFLVPAAVVTSYNLMTDVSGYSLAINCK